MTAAANRWREVKDLLGQALELPPEERATFLDLHCDEPELRREAHSYLAAYDSRSFRIGASGVDGFDGLDDFEILDRSDVVGDSIGPYRLLRRLGTGGMGEVFLAEQEQPIRRTVALKLIRSQAIGVQTAARFAAERQTLALMNHPNIARVFDAGESRAGRAYVAMELVEGPILTRYCDECRLDLERRLELFVAVCRGVQHAHQKGVIHRDLKPSNILVATEDGQAVPKIIDFGLAKAIREGALGATHATEHGQWLGTPDYMSPEQAGGTEGEVDTRSDVYSLGVLLYELLTGVLPFDPQALRCGGLAALLATLRDQEPPRMSARVWELGPLAHEAARARGLEPPRLETLLRDDLDAIVQKALEKDPDRRYGSAVELSDDIVRHLRHEPVRAAARSATVRLRKLVRRHRLAVTAATIVFVTLLGGIIGTSASLVRALRAEREARDQTRRAEEQAAKAGAVTGFVFEMFKSADPGRSLRPDSTLREVLDRSVAQLDELAHQPLVQAEAMSFLGRTYRALGQFEIARGLLERSLSIRTRELGTSDLQVADVAHDLGRVYLELADNSRARRLLRNALAIKAKRLDLTDAQLASTLNLLGTALKNSGEQGRARKTFERALAIYESQPEVKPIEVAMVLDNLGLLLVESGENVRAQALLRRALALHQQDLGPLHPALAYSLNNLAMAAANLGETHEARALLARAVEIDRTTYGPDHPNVAIGLFNLGELAEEDGDCRTSVHLYQQATEIFRSHYAANHPMRKESQRALAAARSCSKSNTE